jgi:hypothetical protein
MFDITGEDIARLNEADLRTLVALLCEAELKLQRAFRRWSWTAAQSRLRPRSAGFRSTLMEVPLSG